MFSAIPELIMVYSNSGMRPQAFGLPRPIVAYMIENPTGISLRKLYKCCKYFFHRRPLCKGHCIIDEIKYIDFVSNLQFIIDSNSYNGCQLNAFSYVWVTKKISFLDEDRARELMSMNIRWDAKEVDIGGTEITKTQFDTLTKSGTVKKWESWNFIKADNNDDSKVPIEDLLANLVNAKDLTQVFDPSPKH